MVTEYELFRIAGDIKGLVKENPGISRKEIVERIKDIHCKEEISEELEALQKLDAAVIALKAAGYVFHEHTILDKHGTGTSEFPSQRFIKLDCYKELPAVEDSEDEKVFDLRKLSGFIRVPRFYRQVGSRAVPVYE